jgi:hypothetical protein
MNKIKRGPKAREISKELLGRVEQLATRGLSQKQVCHALGFSETWWHAKKQEFSELEEFYKKGQAKGLAEVSNALYEQALSGSTGAACFFLKNRDPDRWSDLKSVNAVQINVGKMSDTQLLEELRSDPVISKSLQSFIPQLDE